MNFRLSEFSHFVHGDSGLVALYNALTQGVIITDDKSASFLQHLPEGVISEDLAIKMETDFPQLLEQLRSKRLLFPIETNQDLHDYLDIRAALTCKKIGILYLLTTDACNLACRYCFIENAMPQGYRFSSLNEEDALRGVDLFAQALSDGHEIEEPQIIFYGGEPMLNFHVIKQTLAYIHRLKDNGSLPQQTSITINTNGTRFTEANVEVLNKVRNLNIAISLDGPQQIHDQCRPYHGGTGSFTDISLGLEILKRAGVEAGFCCTISRYNVEQLLDIAKWFVEDMHAKSLGFNIMIENCGQTNMLGVLHFYANRVAEQLIACFRYFREIGVYEDRIMRKVNAFVDGKVYYHDCGGCGQQLVIAPNGHVGVCQGYCGSKKYFVNPKTGAFDPHKHPYWKEWCQRSPLNMSQCRHCIALSTCGGGCPYSADLRTGSIWGLDEVFCTHAKATIEFLLKDLIAQMESQHSS